jgi:hypothetical protein
MKLDIGQKYTALQHGYNRKQGMFVQMYKLQCRYQQMHAQDFIYMRYGCFVNALRNN